MTRTVALLTLAGFGTMGAGFLREVAVAYYFGTGGDADAFALAMFYVDGISAVALAGVAGYLMIPVVTKLIQEYGDEEGFRFLETCLLWLAAAGIPVLTFALLRVGDLALVMAPEFDGARLAALVRLLYFGLPAAYLILVSGILAGVLQARRDYYTPVHARTVLALAAAGLLFLSARHVGIVAAGVGLLIGSSGQLVFQWYALRRMGWRLRRAHFRHPALAQAARAAIPILLTFVIMNLLMGGAQRALASGVSVGGFSSLNYAQRCLNLVSGLSLSLATISLTELAVRYGAEGVGSETLAVLRNSLQSGFLMLVPLSALLFIASEPLVVLLFHRGRYDIESVRLTVACLRWLTFSLVPGMVLAVLHRAAPAFGRPWRATVTAVAWTLGTIGATMLMLPRLGAQALAAGFSIGTLIAACMSAAVLRDIVPMRFYKPIVAYAGRVTLIGGAGVAGSLIVLLALGSQTNLRPLESAARLLGIAASFLVAAMAVGLASGDSRLVGLVSSARDAARRTLNHWGEP